MNKSLSSITATTLLALSVSAANAAEYSVFGNWTDVNTIALTNGSPVDVLTGANFTISGTITTDTNAAGYQVTGGTLHATGWMSIDYDPGTGPIPLFLNFDATGYASNAGVAFSSGSTCIGYFAGDCGGGTSPINYPGDYILFDGTGTFAAGYATTQGLQLLGGAGGSSFTVAQPGDLFYNSPLDNNLGTGGAGTMMFFGNSAGIFLGGDLTFTEVPVPAAAWLFGSALIGIAGLRARRN